MTKPAVHPSKGGQNPNPPTTPRPSKPKGQKAPDVEKLADAIRSISRGMKGLLDGSLKRRTIVILIHHSTRPKVPMKTIEEVLHSIEHLEEAYIDENNTSS